MTLPEGTKTSVACEVKLYLAVPSPSFSLLSSPGLIAGPSPVRHRARFRSGAAAPGRTGVSYEPPAHQHGQRPLIDRLVADLGMVSRWPSAMREAQAGRSREHRYSVGQDSFEPNRRPVSTSSGHHGDERGRLSGSRAMQTPRCDDRSAWPALAQLLPTAARGRCRHSAPRGPRAGPQPDVRALVGTAAGVIPADRRVDRPRGSRDHRPAWCRWHGRASARIRPVVQAPADRQEANGIGAALPGRECRAGAHQSRVRL